MVKAPIVLLAIALARAYLMDDEVLHVDFRHEAVPLKALESVSVLRVQANRVRTKSLKAAL